MEKIYAPSSIGGSGYYVSNAITTDEVKRIFPVEALSCHSS